MSIRAFILAVIGLLVIGLFPDRPAQGQTSLLPTPTASVSPLTTPCPLAVHVTRLGAH